MTDQITKAEEIFGTPASEPESIPTTMDIDFGAEGGGEGFSLLAEDMYILRVEGADPLVRDSFYKEGEKETVIKWEFSVHPLTEDGVVRDVDGKEWSAGKRLMWATTKITTNNMTDGTPSSFKQIVAALLGVDPLEMKEKVSVDFNAFIGEKIRGFITFALSDKTKQKFNKIKSYSKIAKK